MAANDGDISPPIFIPPTSHYLSGPDAVILDASWLYEPPPHRNAYEEFDRGPRFPNARWWDLEEVSEPHPDGYPLMLPSAQRFAEFAGKHGVTRSSHVIVYDGEGVFAAPRTAWTFKIYGHEKVSIVDGGLPRAIEEGVPLESGPPKAFAVTEYPVPTVKANAVVEFAEITRLAARSSTTERNTLLVDARPAASYESGHIPSSVSLAFPTSLMQNPAGFSHVRQPEKLRKYIEATLGKETSDHILAGTHTVVNTCGGGLSAAINWATWQSLGVDSRLYDESWSGYSARRETPRVTGPSPF